ncbi:MAG: hypothetical protein GYB65_14380 [Chloroflexi bacterium]|nr:hypothetical protein [Chloroflexota bacterium]
MGPKLIKSNGFNCFAAGATLVFCENIVLKKRRRLLFQKRQVVEAYYAYDFETIREISGDAYTFAKFGHLSDKILQHFEIHPDRVEITRSTSSPETLAAWVFSESIVRIFDGDGGLRSTFVPEPPWAGALYSVALTENGFWAAFPTVSTVYFYAFEDPVLPAIELYGFSYPEHVNVIGSSLYVCEMGNDRICILDSATGEMKDTISFDESVWKYLEVGEHRVVRLQSGIYLLD